MVESESGAFLGVGQSVGGKRWTLRAGDERAALQMAQQLGLPEIVARVLAGRGVDIDAAPHFLEPRLRDQLPDPSHLKDMDKAAARLAAAIREGRPIAVFGDYDVDGATSSALLHRFIGQAGGRVRVYIPDRIKEGYGPNAEALLRLHAEGAGIVVTVDCGTTAHQPLARVAEAGLDVIVIDHHAAEPSLPPAFAIVNPNRLDESSPHRQLAAVGVTFLLAVATNRALRQAGWYAARPEPDLLELLDLVALGTVCDVVPLTGLNRALVAQGLKVVAQRRKAGLIALADVARIEQRCGTYHLGFIFGPRVNAGGRVGAADLGTRLLTTDDPHEARAIAMDLDRLNRERQTIEAAVLEAAHTAVAAKAAGGIVLAAGEGWHQGVIGIVASRLREHYERPACVVTFDGDIGKGSGRSANGFDLGAAVIAARQSGLLMNGGGHSQAAGFTLARDALSEFEAFLNGRMAEHLASGRFVPRMSVDGALALRSVSPELVELLERVGPYGVGNPEPRFVFPGVIVARADIVGEKHVRCILADQQGGRLSGIAFRSVGTRLGDALLARGGAGLHLAGTLRADHWRGEMRVQFCIEDAAPVQPN
ncbi:MAG TPA: single-stranded-DNA-specific exonuclease RecJ [Alphaproteobacteria bacterium]|nr:single-stranded-DNA-specific exonuclease RecJ [Alphaproteobacteria bacterium]